MKTKLLLACILGLFPLSLFAAPSIVGRWQNVKELESYPGSYDALVFNADGTFLYDGPGPHQCQYKVTGNIISMSDCGVACESMPSYQVKIVSLDARYLVLVWQGKTSKYHRVADPGSPEAPQTPQPPTSPSGGYSVQDHIQVLWQGSWYPAVILKIEGNKYFIHYDGYDSSWDEWVTQDRMKHQNDE